MKTVKLNLFWFFSFFLMAETFLATILAIFGKFNLFYLALTTLLLGGLFFRLFKRGTFQREKMDIFSLGVLLFLFFQGFLLSSSTFPTIFGGRDEGSYSNSAILLVKNQGLKESSALVKEFDKIYGTGKALNFPGFYYEKSGQLKSQFLPAYPTYLAIFYSTLGLNGLKIANLFPFVLFIFSVFSLFKLFFLKESAELPLKRKNLFSLLPLVFLSASLPLVIFYKFTLSEIWFASLIWSALYLTAVYFSQQRNRAVYYLSFLPLLLLPLARIEGPAIIFMFLLFFILEDSVNLKKVEYQLPFVILASLFFLTVVWEPNFFINAIKGVAEPLFSNKESLAITASEKNFWPDDWKNFYLGKIFFTYNLWAFWLMLATSVFSLLKKFWDNLKSQNHLEFSLPLLPFFVLLPTFFYFWDANVSLDHPWMLRRFIFSLLPLAVLYSSLFLLRIFHKRVFIFYLLVGALTVTNLTLFFSSQESLANLSAAPEAKLSPKQPLNFFVYTQNQDLLAQLKKIDFALQPGEDDLILVSQKAAGSGWTMLAEPWRNILGRNAIYFFNPKDLEKINRDNFGKIFLVTSENEEPLYADIEKEKMSSYLIENSLILPSKNPLSPPQGLTLEVKGNIYLVK